MSYSHTADRSFAPQLQHELETLAKPWYRRRAIQLFRDESDLAVNPDLWDRIVEAMDQSEHLLLLGSPDSAASPWVAKEVDHWRAHRGTASIAIALTGGALAWNDGTKDFDWRLTTGISDGLTGAFAAEPLWADFTTPKADATQKTEFRESVVRLCAGLRGLAPRDLESEDLRQHRRTIRVFGGIISILIVLTIAVIGAAVYAFRQRNVAEARQLAAQADLLANETDASTERTTLLALESLKATELPDNRRILGQTTSLLLPFVSSPSPEKVAAAAFSPDQHHIAIASQDGTVTVFDTMSWKAIAVFHPSRRLSALAYSSDGKRIATGDGDGTIVVSTLDGAHVYRSSLGEGVKALVFGAQQDLLGAVGVDGRMALFDATGHAVSLAAVSPSEVKALAFSDDGEWLAIAEDEDVRLIEIVGHRELWRWKVPSDTNVVAVGPGGYVAVGWGDSTEGGCALLDPKGHQIWRQPHEGGIETLQFSHDGSKLAVGGWDHMASVLETRTGTALAGVVLSDAVNDVAFSPDGSYVAVAGQDGTTRVVDVARRLEIARLEHGGESVALGGDGRLLLTVGNDRKVSVFAIGTSMEVSRIKFSTLVYAVGFSPDGTQLALGTKDGLRLFDTATAMARPPIGPPQEVESLAFSADGRYIAAGFFAHARVFKTSSGQQVVDIPQQGHVSQVALSGDGQVVAIVGGSDLASVYDVSTGGVEVKTPLHSALNGAVALSNDGRLFAAAGDDGAVYLTHMHTSRANATPSTIVRSGATPSAMTFSPDAHYLAVGDWDSNVRVWEIGTARIVYEWLHAQPISALSFSASGEYLITASQRNSPAQLGVTTRVFSMRDGGEWARVSATSRLGAAMLDNSGTALLTATGIFGTGVMTIERHPLSAEELRTIGCSRVSRNLTCAEWKRYRPGERYAPTCANLPATPCS